jgi:hypothetical protein
MRKLAIVFALAAALLPSSAQALLESRPLIGDDPAALLGLSVAEVLGRWGAPESAYAVRGEEAWQDDVAFRYADGYTLFLYGERLWQVRLAQPYAGSTYGLFLGDPIEKAYSLLGEPYERDGDTFVYRMPYQGYPVRLRLDLPDGKLSDIYVYRADF